MLLNKLLRFIQYPEYYIENFAKKLSGRGNLHLHKNGEFKLIETIIKKNQNTGELNIIDIGANLGLHTKKFLACTPDSVNLKILAVEPHNLTMGQLKDAFSEDKRVLFGEFAVSHKDGEKEFFIDESHEFSGSNSLYQHYYLNSKKQTVIIKTIDKIIAESQFKHIHFIKIDIEGSELDALLGAEISMKNHMIDYIQLEYNQTWIKSGASIERLMEICDQFDYKLFRITFKGLISISTYNYLLDDFYFQNLLLVSSSASVPMKIIKEVLPSEITDL